jgi:glyoxylase-like metal-dependent hydrolase (beta-lactamase superfamily II)
MPTYLCRACGTQYPPSEEPPGACPICEDPRQYIPHDTGQAWLTFDELRDGHSAEIKEDNGILGIGCTPRFAIGQRALLVKSNAGNVLWDCLAYLDDEIIERISAEGGLAAIAISHPHYYATMVEWAHAFACPILIHESDRKWVLRPDPAIRPWQGETHDLGGGLTLIRCGGHYDGSQVLHCRERGALLTGDTVHVIPDRRYVGFMYSYPNVIPLPASKVQAIGAALEPYAFETIYGAWWGSVVERDGSGVVRRSVDRYVRAVTDPGLAS